jgi:hypothetical protein
MGACHGGIFASLSRFLALNPATTLPFYSWPPEKPGKPRIQPGKTWKNPEWTWKTLENPGFNPE